MVTTLTQDDWRVIRAAVRDAELTARIFEQRVAERYAGIGDKIERMIVEDSSGEVAK